MNSKDRNATSNEETQQPQAGSWKCGDPYNYTIPMPDGNPWPEFLKPLIDKDNAQCDAWTDEVQNLLIFAGLFSGVVTAFVIQAYKGLQEDPVVALLSQIAVTLADSRNVSSSVHPSQFSPTPSTIRLNIFLFISLILSLATVLIGIVCLQWLREHRRPSDQSPEMTLAILHMRSSSLERWYVPQIFATLPVLLQCALILFFAGIIELLINASQRVVIPVAAVMGLTITFLVLTTILPALQAFFLHHRHPYPNDDIPSPCPYKSPQSNILRRLITSSILVFSAISTVFGIAYRIIAHLVRLPRHISDLIDSIGTMEEEEEMVDKTQQPQGFEYMKVKIFDYWRTDTWLTHDLAWLAVRDHYFQSCCPEESWLYKTREDHGTLLGWYDTTKVLCDEINKANLYQINAGSKSPVFTGYHCILSHIFESSPATSPRQKGVDAFTRYRYLTTYMKWDEKATLSPFPRILEEEYGTAIDIESVVVNLREEAAFMVLNSIQKRLDDIDVFSLALSRRLGECYLRLVDHLYGNMHRQGSQLGFPDQVPPIFNPQDLYSLNIYDSKDQLFTWQWARTLDSFFRVIVYRNVDINALTSNLHVHRFFQDNCYNFWRELYAEISDEIHQDRTVNQVIATLKLVEESLTFYLKYDSESKLELLYYSVAFYVVFYRRHDIDHAMVSKAVNSMIPLLFKCRSRFDQGDGSESSLKRSLGGGKFDVGDVKIFSDEWWSALAT